MTISKTYLSRHCMFLLIVFMNLAAITNIITDRNKSIKTLIIKSINIKLLYPDEFLFFFTNYTKPLRLHLAIPKSLPFIV